MIIFLTIAFALLAIFCLLLFACIGALHNDVEKLKTAEQERLARELNRLLRERQQLCAERDSLLLEARGAFCAEADAATKH